MTDFALYHMWRNAIWILAKDMPLRSLLSHGVELMFGQRLTLQAAADNHKVRLWAKALRDALIGMPRVLRKRRLVQQKRRISARALDARIGPDGGAI
jgi:hypothetical protein